MTGSGIPTPFAHSFSVMKMAQGFISLGHNVEVVTAASFKIWMWKRKIPDIISHYGLKQDIKVIWLRPSIKGYITGWTSNDAIYCRKAALYAVEKEFDIVYSRNYLIPSLTIRAGLPTIIESHTTLYDIPVLQEIYKVAHMNTFKGLVTIHEDIKQEHIRRGVPEEKVLVLEDGVDIERFDIDDDPKVWRGYLGLEQNGFYAIYCGHLYAEKGIEIILEAAKELKDLKDLKFLLVGGFKRDKKHWEKYCRKKGISNVLFTGFVSNVDVPKYLKAADCLLLPYKTKMDYNIMDIHTTSPLKLFEYMAAKRVIVATDISTVSKILGNKKNALLAKPSVEDFSEKIIEAIKLVEKIKNIGSEISFDIQKFTWMNRCQTILGHAKKQKRNRNNRK
jgi:glycosyltransferase involved in cell wall biosynthesis